MMTAYHCIKGEIGMAVYAAASIEELADKHRQKVGATFCRWIRHVKPGRAQFAVVDSNSPTGGATTYYSVFAWPYPHAQKPNLESLKRSKRSPSGRGYKR